MISAEKNIITLVNGKGEKKEFKIKLTFETKENDNFYIVYADPKLDEDGYEKIYAGIYKEENGKPILLPVEKDEEWALIEELLAKTNKEIED